MTAPRCAWAVHGLTQSPTRQPQDYSEIIFKIIVYAIMVSQGRHVANVGHVHGARVLPYCTSYHQTVKMSFQNWVPVCSSSFKYQTVLWDSSGAMNEKILDCMYLLAIHVHGVHHAIKWRGSTFNGPSMLKYCKYNCKLLGWWQQFLHLFCILTLFCSFSDLDVPINFIKFIGVTISLVCCTISMR